MSTAPIHERDEEIVSYVLGIGDPGERRAFERDFANDASLRTALHDWEDRLAPLDGATMPFAPLPALWTAIEGRLDHSPDGGSVVVALMRLRRSRARWRAFGVAASGLAAALALVLGIGRVIVPHPSAGTMVAVLNHSGEPPALIVRVEPATHLVQVRTVKAETPAAKSLQLWSVVQGSPPSSIGLVDEKRITMPAALNDLPEGSTVAVSVEPRGGSPTGAPTGPVIYSGRLIPDT